MVITVLIGPSGAGKSTLLAATARRVPLTVLRTVTTRPRRPGEDDTTHRFVTPATFATLLADGAFLGTHRQYGHDYGLPLPTRPGPDGPDIPDAAVVTCLRAAVVERLRQRHPDLDVIALDAPVEVLTARLTARGDHDRVDAASLRAEADAGRGLADLVLDATEPVDRLAERLAVRISASPERTGRSR